MRNSTKTVSKLAIAMFGTSACQLCSQVRKIFVVNSNNNNASRIRVGLGQPSLACINCFQFKSTHWRMAPYHSAIFTWVFRVRIMGTPSIPVCVSSFPTLVFPCVRAFSWVQPPWLGYYKKKPNTSQPIGLTHPIKLKQSQ